MTAHDDFDRQFSAWLQEAAPRREPEPLLGEVLARTARTRRRPAWRIPERWIPMSSISTRTAATGTPVPWRTVGLIALLVLALVGGALVIAGSQRNALPAPFGPAANGVIAYSVDGDIVVVDPPTGSPRTILAAASQDGFPLFSPDGQRFAFLRDGEPGSATAQLWIADADGANERKLVDAPSIGWAEWSPDGEVIATTMDADPTSITLVRTDGSGTSVIQTGLALADSPVFRPPDGSQLTFLGRDLAGTMGIYQVARDGSGLVRLELDPGFQTDEFYDINLGYYFSGPVWDPTGQTLLFHTLEPAPGAPAGPGFRIHVADVDAAGVVNGERILEFDPEMDDEYHAAFLPDGETIIYESLEGVRHELWIASTVPGGDAPRALGVTATQSLGYLVAPDGSLAVVAWTPFEGAAPEVVQLDLATGVVQPLGLGDDFSWQRLAP